VTSQTGASLGICKSRYQAGDASEGERRDAPLEAGLDGHAAILRVNVNHADITQYRAALIRRCFRAQCAKVCVVPLERIEERVARGDGRECEGGRDKG
jgi:hypothetical protein